MWITFLYMFCAVDKVGARERALTVKFLIRPADISWARWHQWNYWCRDIQQVNHTHISQVQRMDYTRAGGCGGWQFRRGKLVFITFWNISSLCFIANCLQHSSSLLHFITLHVFFLIVSVMGNEMLHSALLGSLLHQYLWFCIRIY